MAEDQRIPTASSARVERSAAAKRPPLAQPVRLPCRREFGAGSQVVHDDAIHLHAKQLRSPEVGPARP